MTRALPDDGAFADMARQARRRLPRLFAEIIWMAARMVRQRSMPTGRLSVVVYSSRGG